MIKTWLINCLNWVLKFNKTIMMKRSNFLILIAVLSIVTGIMFSCHQEDDDLETCRKIEFNNGVFDNGVMDGSTNIVEFDFQKNCLELTFSYGGGCEEHKIDLAARGWIKTNPPRVEARIIHDNRDPCDALLTETILFDLEPLRYADNEELIIEIEGFDQLILHQYTD